MAEQREERASCLRQCSTPFGIRDHGGRRSQRGNVSDYCAQRLSASEIMAEIAGASWWSITVLNAFRHQRSWRSSLSNRSIRPLECSTPFGIRDHGGPGFACLFALLHVLNAFRHQRSWRRHYQRYDLKPQGAQRLSASEIMAVLIEPMSERFPQCSTPFGIRDHGGKRHLWHYLAL